MVVGVPEDDPALAPERLVAGPEIVAGGRLRGVGIEAAAVHLGARADVERDVPRQPPFPGHEAQRSIVALPPGGVDACRELPAREMDSHGLTADVRPDRVVGDRGGDHRARDHRAADRGAPPARRLRAQREGEDEQDPGERPELRPVHAAKPEIERHREDQVRRERAQPHGDEEVAPEAVGRVEPSQAPARSGQREEDDQHREQRRELVARECEPIDQTRPQLPVALRPVERRLDPREAML